jgi:outer membrane protein insertion porin family
MGWTDNGRRAMGLRINACARLRPQAALLGTLLSLSSLCFAQPAKEQAPKTAPQVEEVLPSYEGQRVVSVELAGRPDLDVHKLEFQLAQREGEPFSRSKVDQSVRALKSLKGVDEVEIEVRPQADGIRVLFVLQPAVYFGIYDFPGATDRFAYSRLLQVADYPPRGAYTPVDVEIAQKSITNFLQKNGYFEAQVTPEIQTDASHGLANVIFHAKLNRRGKFGNVVLDGAPPAEQKKLQGALRSWMARLRGAAIRRGKPYSLKNVENATQYLESQLLKREYLGSRVKLRGAEYDPATHRADVHYDVTTGPRVHVKVAGAHLWGRTRRKLLPIYQQAGLNPELIQEGRQNLISHFQSKGFFDVQVDAGVKPGPTGQTVFYEVTKGPRHKVKEVDIAGNRHLSENDLRGHVKVQKAGWWLLSHGKFSEKLVRTSVANLKRVYQANGFSSVQVTPEVTNEHGNIAVRFRVDEGPQDIVEARRLEGNNTVPENKLAPDGLKVTEGRPYSTKLVDEDRNQIMAQYLRLGYPNANFRATARPIDKDPHRLEVVYHITEGPRVIIDQIVTLGRKHTRQSFIDRTAQLKSEDAMREDELFASESRLYNLGVFDWAQIDPRRQVTTQTQEDVLVKVHEAKRNEITYGFGFEVINRGGSVPSGTVALPGLPPVGLPESFKTSQKTFWGPRGTFEYTRRNMRGLAETFSLSALGARLVQRGAASYAQPHFFGSSWASNLALSGEHNSETPIFTSFVGDFGFALQKPINKAETQTVLVRYGLRRTAVTDLLIPDLVPPEDRHVLLSTVAGSYIRDTRDNPLDAHKGIYQTAEIDFNPTALGSSVNFARLRTQAAYYRDIAVGIIWANSLRIGIEKPFAGSHVPVSELFFSGGGSTLRGFPLNGAGPQRQIPACGNPADPATCSFITVPVGGRQLFILNSEFRIPVPIKKGLGIAAFYDGGNVFEHVGFRDFGANYTNSIGIGLRYATPVGAVRFDIGHNLNALPGIKATQVFVTLGQAF